MKPETNYALFRSALRSAIMLALTLSLATVAGAQARASHGNPWSKWTGPRVVLDPNARIVAPEISGRTHEATQPDSPLRLEGTWEINEIFGPGSSDPALFTFSAGPDADHGTVVMSDTYIFTGNPSCIPAQGAWKRIGDRSFIGKHKCFAFDDNNGFAPDGWVIWRYAVVLSEDGSTAFGKTVLDFYDADGNYLFSSVGALQGTRMDPQAPPL